MRIPIAAATLFVVPVLVAAQGPLKVGSLAASDVKSLAEINTDKVKGQPSRVAWSPDGSEIYVEMLDGQFANRAAAKISHHIYKVQNGAHQQVSAEPAWVTDYWTAKSGQASPDNAAFKIDLKTESRTEKTVSTPMGGDLARGGGAGGDGGTASAGDALAAAYNQQAVPVHTMRLKGEVVGEYVNSVIVPGQTFGWGPAGSKVIAYSALKTGRLVVMDDQGVKQEIDGTGDALFPAWSPDGKRLAWLQRDGKKKYVLKISLIG
ncbi:MAG TPA: hypothetical protein VM791_15105 [Vicinamibacterales bacterium]|jgi:dipeptidyl aminopeptidase/acylaminoacyl peptidase|nr:hypothetical protein [Vicinamibacterales bacterium]